MKGNGLPAERSPFATRKKEFSQTTEIHIITKSTPFTSDTTGDILQDAPVPAGKDRYILCQHMKKRICFFVILQVKQETPADDATPFFLLQKRSHGMGHSLLSQKERPVIWRQSRYMTVCSVFWIFSILKEDCFITLRGQPT